MKIRQYKKKKRISKKLKKFFKKHNLENITHALTKITDTSNYFDFSTSDNTKIGYVKQNKIPTQSHLLNDANWRKSNGTHAKIGKLLARSGVDVSQKDIQKASAIMSNLSLKKDTKFIITNEIVKYYNQKTYSTAYDTNESISGNGGALFNSCMRSSNLSDAIRLYEKFGASTVQLLVLLQDDMVIGRALLWHKVKYDDGENMKYLDRIYAVNDNIRQYFLDYAETNNFRTYAYYKKSMRVSVSIDECDNVPYFDTFRYYDSYGEIGNFSGDVALDGVSGDTLDELTNHNRCECDECGREYDGEYDGGYDEHNGQQLCDDCCCYVDSIGEIRNISDCCNVDGDWFLQDDCVYSEYHGEYLHQDNAYYSDYEGDYFAEGDLIFCEVEEIDVLPENCTEYNNGNFYSESYNYGVNIDGDWFDTENDDVVNVDGNWFESDDERIFYNDESNEYEILEKQYTI